LPNFNIRIFPLAALLAILGIALLFLTPEPASAQPPNDNFENAIAIPELLPYTNTQSTIGATSPTTDPVVSGCFGAESASVWYRFTAPGLGAPGPEPFFSGASTPLSLLVRTAGSNYDTELALFRETSWGELGEADCNSDTVDKTSSLTFEAQAGETYYFLVDGFDGATGDLVFSLTVSPPPIVLGFISYGEATVVARSGAARIHGVMLCSRPATLTLHIELEQERRNGRITRSVLQMPMPTCSRLVRSALFGKMLRPVITS
jgi:hypothetical protein